MVFSMEASSCDMKVDEAQKQSLPSLLHTLLLCVYESLKCC